MPITKILFSKMPTKINNWQKKKYRRFSQLFFFYKSKFTPCKYQYFNEATNDRWIVEHIFPGKKQGYFLEIGAANGKAASSCYLLEKELNWTGICVEPHSDFFAQLTQNRPHSICENVCLADKPGQVAYIEGDDEAVNPYLSGIKANLEQFKYQGKEIASRGKVVTKEAITLEQLLKKHNAPKIIDYAAFDIEGSELKVLQDFPFDEYKFLALTLECDSTIWQAITELLESNNYKEVSNPFNVNMPWERYWIYNQTML